MKTLKKALISLLLVSVLVLSSCVFELGNASEADKNTNASGSDAAEYVPGKTENGVWYSEELGLKYTLPQGYVMKNDEELAELIQATESMYKKDENGNSVLDYVNLKVFFELYAADIYGNNVNVVAEKTFVEMDEMQYAELALKNMENQTNVEFKAGEPKEIKFNGIDVVRIDMDVTYSGVTMKQTQLIKACGTRMLLITASAVTVPVDTVLEGFSAYTE